MANDDTRALVHLPTHALLNLTALDDWTLPEQRPAVFLGAIMPDLPVLAFYFVCKHLLGMQEDKIWKDVYYRDKWFNLFATFHSIPITALLAATGLAFGSTWLALFGVSMLLHNVADLPLHAEDAHRHFYPLSNWRFKSPVSYWNPTFWGRIVAFGELLVLAACSVYLYPTLVTTGAQIAVVAVNAIFAAGYAACYLGGYGSRIFESVSPE